MKTLKAFDLLALGFMTFALFLGAGNVIFPPSAGLAAGEHMLPTALGFMLTAVGLPLLTLIALARVGGGLAELTTPLGRWPGLLLSVAVYLAIGPLFATPRTTVVSYELGVVPFVQDSWQTLLCYSVLYFAAVIFLALKPGQLVQRVGMFITPILLLGLALLGAAAVLFPAGEMAAASAAYREGAMLKGFVQGYLTMDTLGALVFGIVITTAIRDRGISTERLITRYTVVAALIAALGLSLVYLALFYLGSTSSELVDAQANGGDILAAYVQFRFGTAGSLLLAVVIILACMTTAVGLLTACGEFFSKLLPVRYAQVVWLLGGFSMLVANQGLDSLIQVSIPVLVGLYPLAIVLVCLSLVGHSWARPQNVLRPVMLVTLVFGVVDGLKAAGFMATEGGWLDALPLADQSLGWLMPVLITLMLAILVEYLRHGRLRRSAE
ncbi:MAG: branched-chain amino acid transport system II carrier protein [Halopseudomonas sp.]|uniref:branched-chain amino acid transport system II carrier protein n=1 Tax=Halopseudomonas sp. TaxID=2901191 RepID=UPI003001E69B